MKSPNTVSPAMLPLAAALALLACAQPAQAQTAPPAQSSPAQPSPAQPSQTQPSQTQPSQAQPSPARPAPIVQAAQPWARATAPQQQVGAAYVTLTSPAGDRLVSASTPLAASVEIHEMRMDGAVMQMREVAGGLPLPPGQPVTLSPGGYHMMLVNLVRPLRTGESIPLQLRFQNAPPLDLMLQVTPAGARGPSPAATKP